MITGNGTHLASWDAKLGFQRLPFIATLSNLTTDGGLVVMARVEVRNIFPIQYIETLPSGEREMRVKKRRPQNEKGGRYVGLTWITQVEA